jgi:hypothetical protein
MRLLAARPPAATAAQTGDFAPLAVRVSVCGPFEFLGVTWPAACIDVSAISVSQLVLNEIARGHGDPGTVAPFCLFLSPDLARG